jgi:hypothetical protein
MAGGVTEMLMAKAMAVAAAPMRTPGESMRLRAMAELSLGQGRTV